MSEGTAVVKAHELVVANAVADGVSTQPKDDVAYVTPEDAITPPLSLEHLAQLTGQVSNRRQIIEAVAANTVGQGYSIEPANEHATEDSAEEAAEVRADLEACWARDTRLDRPTATTGFYSVKYDEEECGQGYIEVSRNRVTGKINGLFHLPGSRMRRLANREGWVLLKPGWAGGTSRDPQATRFYNFGEKVAYNEDGTPQPRLADTGRRWATNEVLSFRLYTSESRDYGLPRDVALASDYAGDRLAAASNLGFFDSSGVPPTVLFIQGEENSQGGKVNFTVPQQTVERLANTMKSNAGTRSRVAIVPVPPGTKVNGVTLAERPDADPAFNGYRDANLKRELSAFRLQPVFVAVADDGAVNVEVQRSITMEQLFNPEQTRWEDRLNSTILRELSGGRFGIRFARLEVENNAVKREAANKAAEHGAITNREYREANGWQPLPEAAFTAGAELDWRGQKWESAKPAPGQVPHGWNDALMVAKGLPRGAENRNQLTDNRGGTLVDDTTSNRPDQLPTPTQEAVEAVKSNGHKPGQLPAHAIMES